MAQRRDFNTDHARGLKSQDRLAGILQARFQYRPSTKEEDEKDHIDHWIRLCGEWKSLGGKFDFHTVETGNVLVEDRGNRYDPKWIGWAYAECDYYLFDLLGMGLVLWADMPRLTAAMPGWKKKHPEPVYTKNKSRSGEYYESVSYLPWIEDFTETCVIRVITYGEWRLGMPARETDIPGWVDYFSCVGFSRRRR